MGSSTTEWLMQRPKWLQFAAMRLIDFGFLNEDAISELVVLCQLESNNEFPEVECFITPGAFDAKDSEEIRLCSISEVEGINKLAPRKPLEFGTSNIVVVYGQNGSGKSGYVRLLKHVCGSRNSIRGQLLNNVFTTEEIAQKAKVAFLKDGIPVECFWSGTEVFSELNSIDIFDTSYGHIFIGSEDEARYEPPVLSFFSRIIEACEKVAQKLDEATGALYSKLPNIPDFIFGSKSAIWIEELSSKTTEYEVSERCSFTQENEVEIQDLQKRISEVSPSDKAKQLRTKKSYCDSLFNDIKFFIDQLSDENCRKIIDAYKKFTLKKMAAEATSRDLFSTAKIEGIGSEVWKELWDSARKFSEELVYVGQIFPHVQEDSVCVLCHQPLNEEAKNRFISFESYIKGETQKQAADAEKEVLEARGSLPNIPNVELIMLKIDAAGIENQGIIEALNSTLITLRSKKAKVISNDSDDDLSSFYISTEWIEELQNISKGFEERAQKYEQDAEKDNRVELLSKLKELQANEWVTQHKSAILEEVNRLKSLDKIREAKRLTSTRLLSTKKGELAETLITEAFVQRFNYELNALGASRIKVKLVKTRVSRGKVLHTLQLEGATHKVNEVLSEGENRIVSIAAFLADVTGRTYPTPFVFDDPISSLDQDYEEAVVQRLCTIACERQVVIFTHRLTLLSMLQDYAKTVCIEPNVICITEEPWGTGEPGDPPLFAKKPDGALSKLIDERLPKARNLLNEHGRVVYEPDAKALCSDFRILLERMIEYELMADVVQRYRRAINTKGKIEKLAKISVSDCKYFEDLMTKYSRYEHSQPTESPLRLPEPDELQADFNSLKVWQAEFKSR